MPEGEEAAADGLAGVVGLDEATGGETQGTERPGIVEQVAEHGGHAVDVDGGVDYRAQGVEIAGDKACAVGSDA